MPAALEELTEFPAAWNSRGLTANSVRSLVAWECERFASVLSLRARRARFEFSYGERRRGLRNVGFDHTNAYPWVRCESSCGEHRGGLDGLGRVEGSHPTHHKARSPRAHRSLAFYLRLEDSFELR